jgi:hypothetical protein
MQLMSEDEQQPAGDNAGVWTSCVLAGAVVAAISFLPIRPFLWEVRALVTAILVFLVAGSMVSTIYQRHCLLCRQRERSGWCVECGYDLCATPARCPECVTAPAELNRREAQRLGTLQELRRQTRPRKGAIDSGRRV